MFKVSWPVTGAVFVMFFSNKTREGWEIAMAAVCIFY
jgi:hypothetical protein